jgi:hypothetical protein
MANHVKPIPEGYHTVTPYLICDGASHAIEFYKKAFGAAEAMRMAMPNGKIGHAEIKIGDSFIMLADDSPEVGARAAALWWLAHQRAAVRGEHGRHARASRFSRRENCAPHQG